MSFSQNLIFMLSLGIHTTKYSRKNQNQSHSILPNLQLFMSAPTTNHINPPLSYNFYEFQPPSQWMRRNLNEWIANNSLQYYESRALFTKRTAAEFSGSVVGFINQVQAHFQVGAVLKAHWYYVGCRFEFLNEVSVEQISEMA